MSSETVAELYEQLARERAGEAAGALTAAFADPERAEQVLGDMATTLEDAAAVITVIAGHSQALAHVRGEMAREAASLVALAGRLEEAADLGRL